MPATSRHRAKGRRSGGSFAALPHDIFRTRDGHPSAPAATLSRGGLALLIDIVMQYDGANNGNLCAAFTFIRKQGPKRWTSKGTLDTALKELVAAGFLQQTRQGGRNLCSLYAITWKPIDPGPHHAAATVVASALYKPEHQARREVPRR